MTRVRVGVIGCGAVAQIAHLPILAAREDVELVGLCDNDLPKAQSLATRFAVPAAYDDIEDLLRYGRPEAVLVATPNHLHEVHVRAALSAECAVLCERPLALTAVGVEHIQEAARQAGRPVVVGMSHRYRSDIQAVRAFVAGGELGALRAIRTGWYLFRPSRAELGWRRRLNESGGGALFDLGLPLLDLALWLADCPEDLSVRGIVHRAQDDAVEDAASVLLTCASGLSVFVDVAWRYVGDQERFWFDVMGEDGSARVHPLRIYKELHGAPVNVTPTGAQGRENLYNASYRAEWASFLAVARGEVAAPDLDQQVLVHRVLEAVYASARDGRAVDV
ncbi:MAG: Gfo/Idh/MocA family oxidoreductase [Gemmatimonadales bacterium]